MILKRQGKILSCLKQKYYELRYKWRPNGIYYHLRYARVAKCHGYDGYIRVKELASWGKKFRRAKKLSKICVKNLRSNEQTTMN